MDIVLKDGEIEEILIEDVVKSQDNGKVIIKGEDVGKRGKGLDDLHKEIIARDAIQFGPSKAAEIHNVPQSSASKYADGKDIADDDARARVLSVKHDIADVAVTKLLETLGLINPKNLEKESDKVRAAAQLASVVEKVTPKDNSGGGAVHLHLHAPKQKPIEQYDIIDV